MIAFAVSGCTQPEPQHARPQAPTDATFTTSDGVTIFYRVEGDGQVPIIAVHGGPGETIASIEGGLRPLAAHHVLVTYDQRGNGRSSPVTDTMDLSVARQVQDLDELRSHLGAARVIAIGHSWGGGLAALYTAAHADHVSRLVMIDPMPPEQSFSRTANQRRMAGFDDASMARIAELGQAASAGTAADPAASCREFYTLFLRNYYTNAEARRQAVVDECAYPDYSMTRAAQVNARMGKELAERQWAPAMRAVTVPVLIVHGDADFIPMESSQAWRASFTNAQLVPIAGASHFSFADQPTAVIQAIEHFLDAR